jgi:PAS domain S-box-containing protein
VHATSAALQSPGPLRSRISFSIEATQCGAALYCLALGTLMLVAPHVFNSAVYQAFHSALPWWGLLFSCGSLGIGLAAMRSPGGLPRLLLNLPALIGMVAIALIWVSLGAWPVAIGYGLLSAALLYSAAHRPSDVDEPERTGDLLPLVFGLIGIVNGAAILTDTRNLTVGGLDPALFRALFGTGFIASGGVMLIAQIWPGRLICASAIAQMTLAFLLIIICALIFLAGPRAWITLVYTVAFAPILGAQPWLGPRLHHAIHSFRARVALLAVAAAALPLIATVSLVSSQQDRRSVDDAIDAEVGAAQIAARDLDRYLTSRSAAISALAGQPDILLRSLDEQGGMLSATARAYPDLANVALYDANGVQLARSDQRPLTTFQPGSEIERFFREVSTAVAPVHTVLRESTAEGPPVVAIGVPVRDRGGALAGAVIAGIGAEQLTAVAERTPTPPGREIFLVDEQGRAITQPTNPIVSARPELSSLPPVRALLSDEQPQGMSYGSMADRQLAGTGRLEATLWGVISVRPAAEALAGDYASREAVLIILWLAIVASGAAGVYMASRIVRPLRLLGEAASEFGGGVHKPLPTAHTREIVTLIAEIGRMRDRIDRREQDLQAAELHYRQLFEGSPAPAWIMERATLRFLDVNDATVRALGYARADLLTMSLTELAVKDDPEETAHSYASLSERLRLVTGHSESQEIDVEISTRPITFRSLDAWLTVMHDITERTQAVALRDEFFSIAAHELKTPITVLRGQSQLNLRRLSRNGAMPAEQIEAAFTTIDEQSRKLQRLVEQLLDVSRIESGRLAVDAEETDLVAIARSAVASARLRGGNRTIELHSPSELVARADPLRLEQVLANLLDNALKYSPNPRPIEVSLSVHEEAPAFVELSQRSDDQPFWARIEVRDYGRGIPDEDRERIFQRFQQVHPNDQVKGFGLGLYVCRQIVELHGGSIHVESAPGQGTRFIVALPIEARVLAEAAD